MRSTSMEITDENGEILSKIIPEPAKIHKAVVRGMDIDRFLKASFGCFVLEPAGKTCLITFRPIKIRIKDYDKRSTAGYITKSTRSLSGIDSKSSEANFEAVFR